MRGPRLAGLGEGVQGVTPEAQMLLLLRNTQCSWLCWSVQTGSFLVKPMGTSTAPEWPQLSHSPSGG